MTEREALKLALEALENKFLFIAGGGEAIDLRAKAITAIREALAQPEQEPVAWAENDGDGNVLWDRESCFSDDPEWLNNPMPLYTTPPQPEQSQVEETLRYEIDALENKLAECRAQQPEPVIDKSAAVRIATALGWEPKRKPLTDEEIMEMYNEPRSDAEMLEFARAIEAAHGIKGDA